MSVLRFTIFAYFFMSLSSCSNKGVTNDDIDKFISKYNNEGFGNLKGISINQRSRDINEVVYVVGRFEENKPPYFVEYNIAGQSVTKINKSLLDKDSVPDYLTHFEITNAVNTIRKHDFFLLAVDSSENVYINPFYANEPAYLLRLKIATGDSVIRKGYVYELYKGNWYLNKTRRKN